MKKDIPGPFYIYILFNKKAATPIYAGSTNNPKSRYAWHKAKLKNKQIVMAIYKKAKTRELALREESKVVKYLIAKYGNAILNKNMISDKYKTKVGIKLYEPIVKWKTIPEKQKAFLYRPVFYGDYAMISKYCHYNAERLRQVFIRKPSKLHPDLYHIIKKYQEARIQLGYLRPLD